MVFDSSALQEFVGNAIYMIAHRSVALAGDDAVTLWIVTLGAVIRGAITVNACDAL